MPIRNKDRIRRIVMKVLIAGSFDPPTLGHLDIITRAATLFDSVIVAVSPNSSKRYMFDVGKRCDMLNACCSRFANVTVDVCDCLVADYAATHDVDAIVKGLRSAIDFDYEATLDRVNKTVRPIETLFLAASPELSYLSSTVAREMIKYGRNMSDYLPEEVVALI